MILFNEHRDDANKGWDQIIEIWKQIKEKGNPADCGKGYWVSCMCVPAAMLAVGQAERLRQFVQSLPITEEGRIDGNLKKAMQKDPIPSHQLYTDDALDLQAFALRAMACNLTTPKNHDKITTFLNELNKWRPEDFVELARKNKWFAWITCGAAHPTLLCARLYYEFGIWDTAEKIVEGFLNIPKDVVEMHPLALIEAWRLMAKIRYRQERPNEKVQEALREAKKLSDDVGYKLIARQVQDEMTVPQWLQGVMGPDEIAKLSFTMGQRRVDEAHLMFFDDQHLQEAGIVSAITRAKMLCQIQFISRRAGEVPCL